MNLVMREAVSQNWEYLILFGISILVLAWIMLSDVRRLTIFFISITAVPGMAMAGGAMKYADSQNNMPVLYMAFLIVVIGLLAITKLRMTKPLQIRKWRVQLRQWAK